MNGRLFQGVNVVTMLAVACSPAARGEDAPDASDVHAGQRQAASAAPASAESLLREPRLLGGAGLDFDFDPGASDVVDTVAAPDPVALSMLRSLRPQDESSAVVGAIDAGDGWQLDLGIYLFLPAVDATSTVAGVSVDLDLTFGDIWNNFDVVALSGRGELWKDDTWGFFLDFMYIGLDTDMETPVFPKVNVDIESLIIDLGVNWRVLDLPLGEGANMRLKLDLTGGGRIQALTQEIDLNSPPFPVLGGNSNWAELLVGGRLWWEVTDSLALMVRGDASGFGIGSGSDLTWNCHLLAHWRFAERWTLIGGYRWLGLDYSTGSGPSEFGIEGTIQGLELAVTYTF